MVDPETELHHSQARAMSTGKVISKSNLELPVKIAPEIAYKLHVFSADIVIKSLTTNTFSVWLSQKIGFVTTSGNETASIVPKDVNYGSTLGTESVVEISPAMNAVVKSGN